MAHLHAPKGCGPTVFTSSSHELCYIVVIVAVLICSLCKMKKLLISYYYGKPEHGLSEPHTAWEVEWQLHLYNIIIKYLPECQCTVCTSIYMSGWKTHHQCKLLPV